MGYFFQKILENNWHCSAVLSYDYKGIGECKKIGGNYVFHVKDNLQHLLVVHLIRLHCLHDVAESNPNMN